MQPPDTYFRHPQYGASGNLFWPAAWQDQVKDQAYEMHGLKPALVKVIALVFLFSRALVRYGNQH